MSERLFSRGYLRDALAAQITKAKDEIAGLDRDYILNVSEDDLVQHLVTKYGVEPPVIRHGEIHAMEPTDAKVDVSRDFARAIFDRNRPSYMTGTRIVVVVPFDGEADCFRVRPSNFTSSQPMGVIQGQELHLVFEGVDLNSANLRQTYESELRRI